MKPHRNHGARFKRHDGTYWNKDQVRVPTDRELKQRAYKLREVSIFEAEEAEEVDERAAAQHEDFVPADEDE